MLLQHIRNKQRPNKPNPCRPNKVLLYINSDKLEKEKSATKDCRKFSDIKATHGSKMLPKFKKQIKKKKNLPAQHSPKLIFPAFNICNF